MKNNLTISKELALKLYPTANNEFKELLEENFGKDFFRPKDITEIVYNEISLANYLGININQLLPYPVHTTKKQELYINACILLPKVAKIYNEGTELDWKNTNIGKWYPYYNSPSGSVGFVDWRCILFCPTGFYLKNRNLAEKSYNNFEKYWKAFWFYKD